MPKKVTVEPGDVLPGKLTEAGEKVFKTIQQGSGRVMVCPKCGQTTKLPAVACGYCGAPFPPSPANPGS